MQRRKYRLLLKLKHMHWSIYNPLDTNKSIRVHSYRQFHSGMSPIPNGAERSDVWMLELEGRDEAIEHI